jgi:hypothetical protein
MQAVRMMITVFAASAIASACAETKPTLALARTTSAPLTTTSAPTSAAASPPSDPSPSAVEGARAEEPPATDTPTRREQDTLEIRVLEAMENADLALEGLRERSREGSFKDWLAVDKAMRKAQRYKAALMVDLRRLHGDLGMMSWPVFKKGVEQTLEELDGVVSRTRTAPSASQ